MKSKIKNCIVAVSGGFDPIHIGHVRLFQSAKKLGTKLTVILNNDNWLMAKKGYVFMSQNERAEIIKALKPVDDVIITKHPKNPKDMSVASALLDIKPDIFANGGDRPPSNMPVIEIDICSKINCKMIYNVGQGGKIQSSSWLTKNHVKQMIYKELSTKYALKDIFIFDLDNTIAESKQQITKEMSTLICSLLQHKYVAIVSGASFKQFQTQVLKYIHTNKINLEKLFILSESGGSMHIYKNNVWITRYQSKLTNYEKQTIYTAFKKAYVDLNYNDPEKTYGNVLEDRGNQITFSALGQKAPLKEKNLWQKNNDIRKILVLKLKKYLKGFKIRIGGSTSVDITKKNVDKSYAIRQIKKYLGIHISNMVYIGDKLMPKGNDEIVKLTGIDTISVDNPSDTQNFIHEILTKLK